MALLPKSIRSYFEALAYGLEDLLPECRIQNRTLLLNVQAAWEAEFATTVLDLEHCKTILAMADQTVFPPMEDLKTFCEAEAYLFQALPTMGRYEIQLAMRWLLLFLARHGLLNVELSTVTDWLWVWRAVQRFPKSEQPFMEGLMHWLESKGFAPRSMADIVRECRKFRAWMDDHGLTGWGEVGNLELQRYLLNRANGYQNSSKQQILSRVKPILYFYQEMVDGAYRVPDYTVKVSHLIGLTASASSEEIDQILDALEANEFPAMAGLMLTFLLGYGLTLKTLPRLELTGEPGVFAYIERLPCRRGSAERFLFLDLSLPWIEAYWRAWLFERQAGESSYLFTSGHGQKRLQPVSVDFCQRAVQSAVQEVLGYPLPVNHMERGALKRLACFEPITQFMVLTSELSKSHLSRMMVWLSASQAEFSV